MWKKQLNIRFMPLISSIVFVSIGLHLVAAVGNETFCQDCSNGMCPDCLKECTGGCPDGYGEKTEDKSGTICIKSTTATTPTNASAVTAVTTSLPATHAETPKKCLKCQIKFCKSCNASDQGDTCTECLGNLNLVNNTCINKTHNGGSGDGGNDEEDNNGALIGGVVGGVLGGIVVVVVVVLGFIYWRHQRRQGKQNMELGERNDASHKGSQHNDTTSSENEVSRPMPKTDEIQMAHDKVTRYTKDPTEHPKLIGLSQRSETAELDELPLAPKPPQESYDVLTSGNGEDPQSYSPVLTRKHAAPELLDDGEMYVNNASLKASTDSTYGNCSVFRPEYDFPDGPKANMRVSEVARAEDRTVQRSDEVNDDPQEIYLNEYVDSPSAALVGEEDDGQEIYMNENLESDEIYQNMVQ